MFLHDGDHMQAVAKAFGDVLLLPVQGVRPALQLEVRVAKALQAVVLRRAVFEDILKPVSHAAHIQRRRKLP